MSETNRFDEVASELEKLALKIGADEGDASMLWRSAGMLDLLSANELRLRHVATLDASREREDASRKDAEAHMHWLANESRAMAEHRTAIQTIYRENGQLERDAIRRAGTEIATAIREGFQSLATALRGISINMQLPHDINITGKS